MKKILVIALVLMMALPFVSAGLLAEDIHLSKIRIGDYGYVSGNEMDSYVYVFNSNRNWAAKGGSVSIRFIDDGVYDYSGQFDVKSGKGAGRSMITPIDDVAPGEYLVKVTYSNGDIHKSKYRYVYID